MFYNLYFVLSAPEETPKPKIISGEMKVAEVLDNFPQALSLFLESGFQSLANSAARKTFAKVLSIEKACEKHGVNKTEILEKLNRENFKTKAPSENETTNPGREISRGGKCQADTWVGSLVKAYPTTKNVFESHYGEGCFSCRVRHLKLWSRPPAYIM
jgi:hypothetical protein